MGVAAKGTVAFELDDAVVIRNDAPAHHHRTPWFVKGKTGTVVAINGPFFDPESRAHGGDGLPKRDLVSVEFRQVDVWGERYRDGDEDRLLVDIYAHWLERAGA